MSLTGMTTAWLDGAGEDLYEYFDCFVDAPLGLDEHDRFVYMLRLGGRQFKTEPGETTVLNTLTEAQLFLLWAWVQCDWTRRWLDSLDDESRDEFIVLGISAVVSAAKSLAHAKVLIDASELGARLTRPPKTKMTGRRGI